MSIICEQDHQGEQITREDSSMEVQTLLDRTRGTGEPEPTEHFYHSLSQERALSRLELSVARLQVSCWGAVCWTENNLASEAGQLTVPLSKAALKKPVLTTWDILPTSSLQHCSRVWGSAAVRLHLFQPCTSPSINKPDSQTPA